VLQRKFSEERAKVVELQTKLNLIEFKDSTALDAILHNADLQAGANNHQAARQTLKGAEAAYERAKSAAKRKQAERDEYTEFIPKPKQKRDALTLKNLPAKKFDTALTTKIQSAEGKATPPALDFVGAAQDLRDYEQVYKDQLADYEKEVKKALATDTTKQTSDLDAAKFKTLYETRLKEAEEGHIRLGNLPHTKKQFDQVG